MKVIRTFEGHFFAQKGRKDSLELFSWSPDNSKSLLFEQKLDWVAIDWPFKQKQSWLRHGALYYIGVTIERRLVLDSKVFIQLNYKEITTVCIWQIGDA